MKRIFDFLMAISLLLVFSIPLIMIALIIKLTSEGPILFWQDRVGIDNKIFKMPKFRSMHVGTPDVATHLLENSTSYLTVVGPFLRKFSLDELPQMWSILKGDMSLVGPRPALYNQNDLIEYRTERGVHRLVPGVTGWAQVNGRDGLTISKKVEYDEYYMNNKSFLFDIKILMLTFYKVIKKDGVNH